MFLPPTMLPHNLRVLVDPPRDYPEVREETPHVRTTAPRGRWAEATESARPARRPLVGRTTACTD
jgi:hypothetical protein